MKRLCYSDLGGFLFSYSKSHCYVPLKLWISVWASVLAFGPVPSLVYGLLGFYPAWRLSDPIANAQKRRFLFCGRRPFISTQGCCLWTP
ncbi:hypothetical protein ES332_D06G001000v1 [Gossypium tomentosum]|uniref:Uncharacterized protein n=1 Tax=Gossypium tomentosum TaxID=34277 RepID=A0A5D2KDF4_GOSTO|nr:hypothetical protein ES332_D06G001000v1 [Gossypium tomentosum]